MSVAAAWHDAVPPADCLVLDPAIDLASLREVDRAALSYYGDAIWALQPLSQNPSSVIPPIRWSATPQLFLDAFKAAAWALLCHPLPDAVMRRHWISMARKPGLRRIGHTVTFWNQFAHWLEAQDIRLLSQVTAADLEAYAADTRERGVSRNTASQVLGALSRLHHLSTFHLPPRHRLLEPPWLTLGTDEFLPPATPTGENLTEPISPQTMGPLLVWALRFVEEFSHDILAASELRERMRTGALERASTPEGSRALTIYLEQLEATAGPRPSTVNAVGRVVNATAFIAAITGASRAQVNNTLANKRWARQMAGWTTDTSCSLDVQVTGRWNGTAWIEGFDYYTAPSLFRRLVTACTIVILYLTGMRTGEVLGLQVGCCPEPEDHPSEPKRFLIYGRQFKDARGTDGIHVSAGLVRDTPWLAIAPVVTAIRVLERIARAGLLLDRTTYDPWRNLEPGRSLTPEGLNTRIEDFVTWVNDYCHRAGQDNEAIPPDPQGELGTSRFRRTLAWHIARRPGGLVALAVQYGHLRTIVSAGYASRSRGGIHTLMDIETARDVAERLSDLHDAVSNGEGVSGPAARRLISAATVGHTRFGGMIATSRQARALLADPTLNVYENTRSYLLCNFDRTKALCHPGRPTTNDAPSLNRCRSTCANIARTDTQAAAMTARAAELTTQANSGIAPGPLTDRLLAEAEHLMNQVDKHAADRIAAWKTVA